MTAAFSSAAANGYSHAVSLPPGRLVWTSGQVGAGEDGQLVAGWEAQARQVFANLTAVLSSCGAAWHDVVKLTFYVLAVDELPVLRAVRDEFVDTAAPPTSTLVQVAGLFLPECLLEVEAVAWLPPGASSFGEAEDPLRSLGSSS